MRNNLARLLCVLAVTLPRIASAASAGCHRRDPGFTEVALLLAFLATAAALVFRRSRIT